MKVENVISRLENIRETGPGRWIATCPAHEDRSPSLAIREVGDRILIKCWVGCGAVDVVSALGLQMSDLFERTAISRTPLKPHERWIPRDVIRCLAEESMIIVIAASALAAGNKLTSEDNARLIVAAKRFHAAAREVGYA